MSQKDPRTCLRSDRCSNNDLRTIKRRSDSIVRSCTCNKQDYEFLDTLSSSVENYFVDDYMLYVVSAIYFCQAMDVLLTVISSKAVPCPPWPVPPSNIRSAIPFVTKAKRVFREMLLSRRIEYPTRELAVPTAFGASPSSRDTPACSAWERCMKGGQNDANVEPKRSQRYAWAPYSIFYKVCLGKAGLQG